MGRNRAVHPHSGGPGMRLAFLAFLAFTPILAILSAVLPWEVQHFELQTRMKPTSLGLPNSVSIFLIVMTSSDASATSTMRPWISIGSVVSCIDHCGVPTESWRAGERELD